VIDITPATDASSEVTIGDNVRLRWTLDAQADPADIMIIVLDGLGNAINSYSGPDLKEVKVESNGERLWRYEATHVLKAITSRIEFDLDDGVNRAVDTATLSANPKLT